MALILHRIEPMRRTQWPHAAVAQLVERVLGKDEVMGSSPISSFFMPRVLRRWQTGSSRTCGFAEMNPKASARLRSLAKMRHRITGFLIVVLAAAIVFCMTGFSLPQEVFIHGQRRI